jgi:hypothetical protein
MKDQRAPAIRALAASKALRRYWRYEHREPDESEGPWYFECVQDGDEWWCTRQIAPHLGNVSAYDWEHLEDEYGFLTSIDPPSGAPAHVSRTRSMSGRLRAQAQKLGEPLWAFEPVQLSQ